MTTHVSPSIREWAEDIAADHDHAGDDELVWQLTNSPEARERQAIHEWNEIWNYHRSCLNPITQPNTPRKRRWFR